MTTKQISRCIAVLATSFLIGLAQVPASAGEPNSGDENSVSPLRGGGGGGPPSGGQEPSTFGRTVIYLGLLGNNVVFDPTCAPGTATPPAVCVVVQPAPAVTSFSVPNLSSMIIPAGSTKDILLPSMTFFLSYELLNDTSAEQTAEVRLRTSITIQSAVLNLPGVINPSTGMPYNGTFTATFAGPRNTLRQMAPGEAFTEELRVTSDGIASFDRELFLGSNLPLPVVQALFANPMTIMVGLSGSVSLIDSGGVSFGVRFFGDK